MLIGPNAPVVVETGLKGSHMEHSYDFFKPSCTSEYPVVDGPLSIDCYLRGVDICYDNYRRRYKSQKKKDFSLDDADYAVFHSPFNKLVQKSIGRFMYNDFLVDPENPKYASVKKLSNMKREETYQDKDLTNALMKLSTKVYDQKVKPTTLFPVELGNMYCASLYGGLFSLFLEKKDKLIGKRILLFSYGSGSASTLFSLEVVNSIYFVEKSDALERLNLRTFYSPTDFTKILLQNEKRLHMDPQGILLSSLLILFIQDLFIWIK